MIDYNKILYTLNKLDIRNNGTAFTSEQELKDIIHRLSDILKHSIKEGATFAIIEEFPFTLIYYNNKLKLRLNIL